VEVGSLGLTAELELVNPADQGIAEAGLWQGGLGEDRHLLAGVAADGTGK
jgi:hypothetical protein